MTPSADSDHDPPQEALRGQGVTPTHPARRVRAQVEAGFIVRDGSGTDWKPIAIHAKYLLHNPKHGQVWVTDHDLRKLTLLPPTSGEGQ